MTTDTLQTLTSSDGTSLTLHAWEAPAPRFHLLIVHGYMEHGGRYDELAHHLTSVGVGVHAVDLRGHGRSQGARGYIRSFEDYLDDVQAALSCAPVGLPRFLLGHSLGGLIALQVASLRRPPLHGLILSNPYLARALQVPRWKLAAGHLLGKVAPWVALPAGLDAALLTHDAEVVRRHQADPLVFSHATAGWFREVEAQQALVQRAISVACPTLLCIGTADVVACPEAAQGLAKRLQCPDMQVRLLAGQYHEVLQEVERGVLFDALTDWMLAHGSAH